MGAKVKDRARGYVCVALRKPYRDQAPSFVVGAGGLALGIRGSLLLGEELLVELGEAVLKEVKDMLEAFRSTIVGIGDVILRRIRCPVCKQRDLPC